MKAEIERILMRNFTLGDTNKATAELLELIDSVCPKEEYEPYFGWCDVEGCEDEGVNGGSCWRETGYWTVCSEHSQGYREGKPQPKMKQLAIEKEKRRDKETGYLNSG
jgi:hypothetical protein